MDDSIHDAVNADRRLGVAIISNSQTPYRLHLHQRIAREMPEIRLWSLYTHEVSNAPWAMRAAPETGPVMFGRGERAEEQSHPRFALREWRKGGRIIRFLGDHNVRVVVMGGYNDLGRIRVIRWCRRHAVRCFLFGDSNVRGDLATGMKAAIKSLALRRVIRWCSGVMTCGRLGDEYFLKYGASPDRIFRFPYEPNYGLIERVSQESVDMAARRFDLNSGRRRIIYSGRLVPHKRVDLLIDAFAAIATDRADWDLLIVGDGELRHELASRLPMDLRSRATWTGFIDDPVTMGALYRLSDVLVLPSDYEPWGVVVTEAAAAGLPILASDVIGAAAELVRDGVNGRFFPHGTVFAAQLAQMTSPEELQAMKAMAKASWESWHKANDPVAGLRRATILQDRWVERSGKITVSG